MNIYQHKVEYRTKQIWHSVHFDVILYVQECADVSDNLVLEQVGGPSFGCWFISDVRVGVVSGSAELRSGRGIIVSGSAELHKPRDRYAFSSR